MEKLDSLYSQFQAQVAASNYQSLEPFKDEAFVATLPREERRALASLFVKQGEEILFERAKQGWTGVVGAADEAFAFAEKLAPDDAELLANQGSILYKIGNLSGVERYYLFALEKFEAADRFNATFFETHHDLALAYGQVLMTLAKRWDEESFLTTALQLYTRLEKGGQLSADLYWDFAECWVFLGKRSQEMSDFQEALACFNRAEKLGCQLPHFQIDYAGCLLELADLKGDPRDVHEGITLIKKALLTSSAQPSALLKGWTLYALAMKKLALLTTTTEDMQAADAVFAEAITAIPQQATLWLEWGELFLRFGWMRRNPQLIENALEKFTSPKIKECNPLRVAALCGESLVALGIFIDDFKILSEGEARIKEGLAIAPDYPELLFASAFTALAQGIYFEEDRYFDAAVVGFEKALKLACGQIHVWHGLFLSYFMWGTGKKREILLRKSLTAIRRVTELSPFGAHYWSEWGVVYARLARIAESDKESYLHEACQKFQKAIDLVPETPELEWFYHLASAYDNLGDCTGDESYFEKAIDLYNHLLEKVPGALDVRYSMALALSHLGELTAECEHLYRAHDLFESLERKGEDDDFFYCDWGYCLLTAAEIVKDPLHPEEGERLFHMAEERLVKAATLGNTEVYYHLACLYSLADYPERAMEFLYRADKSGSLPSIENLESDAWLDGIRETQEFREFLADRKSR